jgi:hypothetical protein
MVSVAAFYSFDMSDNADALTIEGVFQKYASFAGVNGFEFEDTINTFDPLKWTANGPDIDVNTNDISTTAAVSDSIVWYSNNMPHSYVIEFTFHTGAWGLYFRADGNNNWYRVKYDSADYVSLMKATDGSTAMLFEKELSGNEVTTWGRARIAIRDAQASSDSPLRILYISVWVNDNLILTVADNNSSSSLLKMGLMVAQNLSSSALIFSDIRVASLGEIITVSSLDPGEEPIGAIQRAIEDRYIKYWMRWNGKLKVYKPKARSVSRSLTKADTFNLNLIRDIRQILTHVRVLGAFHFVQVYDDDLVRQFGHRFKELQNTSAWNADDCYNIGLEMLIRSKEQAFQARLDSYGLVLLEVEDRFQAVNLAGDTIDYIIDSISWGYEEGALRATINLRQYFYG